MEHHPLLYQKAGKMWYEWRGKRHSDRELLLPCKGVVTEHRFTLYVPSVPGQVQGLYTNWTTDLGATKRRLKRMLKCKRLRIVRLDASYAEFRRSQYYLYGIKPIGNPHEVKALWGGIVCRYCFDNGYGASVIQHRYSYGGTEGLWELAVLAHTSGGKYVTSYETPITDDVMGRLTSAEVEALLEQIAALPSCL